MAHFLIYLALAAVGFYFGKWLGAIGLMVLYFFGFHSRRMAEKQAKKQTERPTQQHIGDLSWACRTLGVSSSADEETIRKKRKQLLNHYHPDKLSQANETEKRAAEQKIHQINQAFKAIKQAKGW